MPGKNKKNITFRTFSFGCRVNFAEEQEIQKRLLERGYVWEGKKPSVVVINTCAVTDKAEREGRQLIYKIKRENPDTFLVATGCGETNWQRQSLLGKLPIDLAVDNIGKNYLADLIEKKLKTRTIGHPGYIPLSEGKFQDHDAKINNQRLTTKFYSSGRYLIKIQDGCHRFCTYCIVPYLRGRPRSFESKGIIDEINSLPKNIKEVILTAINTESFGKDTGENFLELIEKILNNSKIERLSFGSIHPWSIDDKFLDFYKNQVMKRAGLSGRLVDFFHIPIQSGSDEILTLMKRGYGIEDMKDKLTEITAINPYALIGTDVIVGFLGETKKDFETTYEFFEKSPISKFHIFRFSVKKDTAAYYMQKKLAKVTEKDKRARSSELINLGRKKFLSFQKKLIGKVFSCLSINNKSGRFQEGLLSNQIQVIFEQKSGFSKEIFDVKVIDFRNNKLYAKVLPN